MGGVTVKTETSLQNLDHNRHSSSFLDGALSVQRHRHCLLWHYLLTKQTNLGYSVTSDDTCTVLPPRKQVSATLAPASHWKKKVPTGKEFVGVGSPGIVVVQLPFATNLRSRAQKPFLQNLTCHQLLGSCSPHDMSV